MSNAALISVIIPAYKARNYITEALESAAQQRFQDFEVLVIDDASPDPVDDLLEEFGQRYPEIPVRLIQHTENKGLGGTRNTGAREARGEYLAFLDHDDLWLSSHLENLMQLMQQETAAWGFCATKEFFDDGSGREPSFWGPDPDDDLSNLGWSLYQRCFIVPSSVVIRRQVFLDIGMFHTDEEYHYCEDFDLWQRLLKHDHGFSYSPDPQVYYRKHLQAATSKLAAMALQASFVKELHIHSIPAPKGVKKRILAESYWRTTRQFIRAGRPGLAKVFGKAMQYSLPNPIYILINFKRLGSAYHKRMTGKRD